MEGYTYDAQLLPEHAGFAADPVPCTDSEFEKVFVKQFSGRFEQVKAFGFVHRPHFTSGYYVSPKLLEQHPIENLSHGNGARRTPYLSVRAKTQTQEPGA